MRYKMFCEVMSLARFCGWHGGMTKPVSSNDMTVVKVMLQCLITLVCLRWVPKMLTLHQCTLLATKCLLSSCILASCHSAYEVSTMASHNACTIFKLYKRHFPCISVFTRLALDLSQVCFGPLSCWLQNSGLNNQSWLQGYHSEQWYKIAYPSLHPSCKWV